MWKKMVVVVVVQSLSRVQLLQSHGLQPVRLLCPWDSPDKNTVVGCHSLLQGISPAQVSNSSLTHCRNHQRRPHAVNKLWKLSYYIFKTAPPISPVFPFWHCVRFYSLHISSSFLSSISLYLHNTFSEMYSHYSRIIYQVINFLFSCLIILSHSRRLSF